MSSMSGFNDLDVDSDPETEFRFENIDKEEPKKPQFRRRILKSGFNKKDLPAPINEEEKVEEESPAIPKKMNKLKILSSSPAEESVKKKITIKPLMSKP